MIENQYFSMHRNTLAFVFLSFFLISCDTTRSFSKYQLDRATTATVQSYFGCCGMHTYFADVFENGRQKMQIVYNFNDEPAYRPTVFVFHYGKGGSLNSYSRYIATGDSDTEVIFSESERALLTRLDTLSFGYVKDRVNKISAMTGYRKPLQGEGVHPFPLVKRGYKLPLE